MVEKRYLLGVCLALSVASGCSHYFRSDPSLLYSCIDSIKIDDNQSENSESKRGAEQQLHAFETCIKRT